MQSLEDGITQHYSQGSLLETIAGALRQIGVDGGAVQMDELAPVDEFHTGGRPATIHLLDQMGLQPGQAVIDIGSGIGGTTRLLASRYGCQVTGVDLTPEFVDVAAALSRTVGLGERITYHVGDASTLPFADGSFDAATLLHVGMNIADKPRLFQALARVLKRGGTLGVYDMMRTGDGDLDFPVPWSSVAATSFVEPAAAYHQALQAAGLVIEHEEDRRSFAIEFFQAMRARIAESGPPPLGLHLLMGANALTKVGNTIKMIADGRISPIEMICRRT